MERLPRLTEPEVPVLTQKPLSIRMMHSLLMKIPEVSHGFLQLTVGTSKDEALRINSAMTYSANDYSHYRAVIYTDKACKEATHIELKEAVRAALEALKIEIPSWL